MTTLLHAVMAATLASSGVADPPPNPLAQRLDLFGLQVCLGAVDDGKACDLRWLAPPASPAPAKADGERSTTLARQDRARATAPSTPKAEPLRISLLGRTVCLTPPAGDAACDVTLLPIRAQEVQG